MISAIATRAVQLWSRRWVRTKLRLHVEGVDRALSSGPVLLVCRHYHHTYDGVALMAALPRPVRIVVAIDWVPNRAIRWLMEYACSLLQWPAVVRSTAHRSGAPAYTSAEAHAANRRAALSLLRLLRQGELVAIFPEAYPNVDPVYTPKHGNEMLAFQAGFARVASLAARQTELTIVPVGLAYGHHNDLDVALRFGHPRRVSRATDIAALAIEIEMEVGVLSGLTTDQHASTQPRAVS